MDRRLFVGACVTPLLSGCATPFDFSGDLPLPKGAPLNEMDIVVTRGYFADAEGALDRSGYFSAEWKEQFTKVTQESLRKHNVKGDIFFVNKNNERPPKGSPYVAIFLARSLRISHGINFYVNYEINVVNTLDNAVHYRAAMDITAHSKTYYASHAEKGKSSAVNAILLSMAERGLIALPGK